MSEKTTKANYDETADFIRNRSRTLPEVGLILGSGLGDLVDEISDPDAINTQEIPHWPVSTVPGHAGRVVLGMLEGRTVMALQGRVHFYEGYTMDRVTLPVRVMQAMGVGTLIVTNAAGGLNPDFRPGDLMLIADHINLIGMAGHHPLRGPHDPDLGPRFPGMLGLYDPELRAIAREAASSSGFELREGVYICVAGPSYETPADVRFLRLIGADAVGMSSVPEVIVARHSGMRALGVSCITNMAAADATPPEDGDQDALHEEVLEVSQIVAPRLSAVVRGVLRGLDKN